MKLWSRGLISALIALSLAGAVGCEGAGSTAAPSAGGSSAPLSPNIVWPKPPDAPRIRYLNTIVGPADVGIKQSFLGRVVDVIAGRRAPRLVRPTGIAEVGSAIYIADPGAGALWILDPGAQTWSAIYRAGDDYLPSPVGVAAGPAGNVFLADSVLGKVFLLDREGKLVRVIASGMQRPVALAYNAPKDRLYVADSVAQKVVVYNSAGTRLAGWGSRGSDDGEFNFPSYLTLSGDGEVLVTDSLNYRVQVFDQDGRFLWKMGRQGDGSGDFASPKGVAMDRTGHIYVVDALFDTVQIFDREGALLLSFGEHGRNPGEFWLPTGAFFGSNDRIYVADSYNQRVQVFEFVGSPEPAASAQANNKAR